MQFINITYVLQQADGSVIIYRIFQGIFVTTGVSVSCVCFLCVFPVCVCVCVLSGCRIISASEIHSRFHRAVMIMFAHDSARKKEEN